MGVNRWLGRSQRPRSGGVVGGRRLATTFEFGVQASRFLAAMALPGGGSVCVGRTTARSSTMGVFEKRGCKPLGLCESGRILATLFMRGLGGVTGTDRQHYEIDCQATPASD